MARSDFHQNASPVIVDLFAGPGGWSEGLRMLGLSELGIEWDEAACATARAAGHERLQADVAALDPAEYPCLGLIASPPCQAWSMAGKGGGRRDVLHVVACLIEMAAGRDTRAETAALCEDPRSVLVVEPLRWIKALDPEWIALEQVPPVLELWELYADVLRGMGYSVWTGILEAERYGVPQTRERAVLMASRTGVAHPPRATHQRYVPKEPQRHDVTLDGEVLPWVSMAEALGFDDGLAYRLARGEGMLERHGERRAVPKDEPAPVITSKARTATWVPTHYDRRQGSGKGDERRMVRPIPVTDPAPTIASDGLLKGRDRWLRNDSSANASRRPSDAPAPTLFFGHSSNEVGWVPDPDERVNKTGAPITVEEASVLQSFRPDYPWQGSRTKQFEQVGNAVPPLLARAVLGELVGDQAEARDAA